MTGVQIAVCIWLILLFASISIFAAWMDEKLKNSPAWQWLCCGGIAGAVCTTFMFLIALFACGGIK